VGGDFGRIDEAPAKAPDEVWEGEEGEFGTKFETKFETKLGCFRLVDSG